SHRRRESFRPGRQGSRLRRGLSQQEDLRMKARLAARLLLAPALAAAAAVAAQAQERFTENPIKEGAWVYPTERIAPAIVEAFCQSGFSVHFADGGFFTVLNQPVSRMKKKLSVDTTGSCVFDAETQSSSCTGLETD